MPQIYNPNAAPRYYAQPQAYRCTIGAAAITSFPGTATVGGVQASGTLAFSAQPAAGSSVTIGAAVITFVTSGGFSLAAGLLSGTILSANGVPLPFQAVGPYGLQVAIGATLQATLANLLGLLRAWPDESLQACHYRLQSGSTILVTARATGTAGNSIALAASSSPASNATASGSTLSGGTAPTSGYAVLVDPGPHPVEIQAAWGICRTNQAAGTMTLFESDGTTLSKVDAVTFAAGNTLSGTQELVRIPFSSITAATTLVVPAWTGLYAYGGTTQVIDITAMGGAY